MMPAKKPKKKALRRELEKQQQKITAKVFRTAGSAELEKQLNLCKLGIAEKRHILTLSGSCRRRNAEVRFVCKGA